MTFFPLFALRYVFGSQQA